MEDGAVESSFAVKEPRMASGSSRPFSLPGCSGIRGLHAKKEGEITQNRTDVRKDNYVWQDQFFQLYTRVRLHFGGVADSDEGDRGSGLMVISIPGSM
jgi:hypothetical protein